MNLMEAANVRERAADHAATMDSPEIISVYERIASLTAQMAQAALDRNRDDFERLESLCAKQVNYAKSLQPAPLKGASLRRKISLLKEIMANDRNIREITEPWQHQLPAAMRH
jgi:flagellar protein FliT